MSRRRFFFSLSSQHWYFGSQLALINIKNTQKANRFQNTRYPISWQYFLLETWYYPNSIKLFILYFWQTKGENGQKKKWKQVLFIFWPVEAIEHCSMNSEQLRVIYFWVIFRRQIVICFNFNSIAFWNDCNDTHLLHGTLARSSFYFFFDSFSYR